jgi:uncharacterized RDD family membrane protein YckC
MLYSGAFRRLFAYMIDCAVMIGCYFLLAALLGVSLFTNPLLALPMVGFWYFGGLLCSGWLYFALMECSKWQGTIGKRALGLKVVDLSGRRISFGRATGRYFGKFLSSILYIGYLMIFWTKKKQGLHDMMASTLVVRESNVEDTLPAAHA